MCIANTGLTGLITEMSYCWNINVCLAARERNIRMELSLRKQYIYIYIYIYFKDFKDFKEKRRQPLYTQQ